MAPSAMISRVRERDLSIRVGESGRRLTLCVQPCGQTPPFMIRQLNRRRPHPTSLPSTARNMMASRISQILAQGLDRAETASQTLTPAPSNSSKSCRTSIGALSLWNSTGLRASDPSTNAT